MKELKKQIKKLKQQINELNNEIEYLTDQMEDELIKNPYDNLMEQVVLTIEDFDDIYDSFPFRVKMVNYEDTIKATWILRIDDNENIYSIIYNDQEYTLQSCSSASARHKLSESESKSYLFYENNNGETIKLYAVKDCFGRRCSISGEINLNNTIYCVCYWP